mgnify:CR=1 FL=1
MFPITFFSFLGPQRNRKIEEKGKSRNNVAFQEFLPLLHKVHLCSNALNHFADQKFHCVNMIDPSAVDWI